MTPSVERYRTSPVAFLEEQVRVSELGKPFKLFDHQREILNTFFQFDANGRLPFDTFIYSTVKKDGKTTINGGVTAWWGTTQEAPNDIKLIANDLEQSQARVYRTLRALFEKNPGLRQSVSDDTGRLLRLTNGTAFEPVANDYSGEAGSNHGFTSWDELWGYASERSIRLWEEMTPVPTRANSIRFITTYAGFEGESELLWRLYQQAVGPEEYPQGQGVKIHPTLPIYANYDARIVAYWNHEPRCPWQTAEYREGQRRTLRPNAFARLHENRWVTGESPFVTAASWDACVDPTWQPQLIWPEGAVYAGVDVGPKHDHSAVVAVAREDKRLVLLNHRIWKSSAADPLDIERTIEAYLRELRVRYRLAKVFCDPYQLHRSIVSLRREGLPVEEYAQTPANLTSMGQNLFELLNGRNIRLYSAPDLRQHALNAVAVESPRGWRIAKEKSSRKIDACVALAMACVGTVDQGFKSPALACITVDDSWQRKRWGLPARQGEPSEASAALRRRKSERFAQDIAELEARRRT